MPKTATNGKTARKSRTKAQRTPDKYLQTSISVIEGVGRMREKSRPFNYERAVGEFHSWCYSAASMNANAVASVPLRLYVKGNDRAAKRLYPCRPVSKHRRRWLDENANNCSHRPGPITRKNFAAMGEGYEEVIDHPALDLLRTMNGFENGYNATFLRQCYQQLTGNAYLHPVMGAAGVPVELWTMPSQWMWIIPSRENFIDGYVYGQTAKEIQQKFDPDEVIHFKRPNPRNLFYGLGCVESCWKQLGIHNAQTDYDEATYLNNARPDYLVAVKGGASSDALDRYSDEVNRRMRGPKNAGKMMAVGGDITVTPLNWNPKDMGNTDRIVQIIATVFGVPISKLQANYNVAGGQAGVSDHQYLKDTVHPLCVSDAEVLNAKYLPLFDIGANAVLCYDDCVPVDEAADVERAVKLISIGAMTIDEYREDEGEDSLDDVPRFNGVPLAMMGQQTMPGMGGGGSAMPPDATAGVSPDAPAAAPAEQSPAVATNDLRQTVGGSAAILALQTAYYGNTISRDSALANAQLVFGFTPAEANLLFPLTAPDAPKSEATIAAEQQAADTAQAAAENKPPQGGGNNGTIPGKAYRPDDAGRGTDDSDSGDRGGPDHPDGDGPAPGKGGGQAAAAMGGADGCGDHVGGACSGTLGAGVVTGWGNTLGHFKSFTPEVKADPGSPGDEVVPKFQRDMEAILRSQILAAIAELESFAEQTEAVKAALAALKDPKWEEALYAAAKPFVQSAISIGGQAGMSHPLLVERFGYDPFDVANPEVQKFVDNYTARLASDVAEYTHVAAKDLLGDGLSQGESIPQLADRIRPWAEVDPLTPSIGGAEYRSQMIARTESARAYVKGEQLAWKQTGVVTGKKWLLAPDSCPICEAAAAEFANKTIPLDANFYDKGETIDAGDQSQTLDYEAIDGPPLHPNCRCDLIPTFEGE